MELIMKTFILEAYKLHATPANFRQNTMLLQYYNQLG
jgi:hypothetical protein